MKKPELLAPAGNLEKLRTAFQFGADAVYIGSPIFGLRKFADNFSIEEMNIGIQEAKQKNKHVYVVLNGFAHDSDVEAVKPLLDTLEKIQPHALIISDLGVLQLVKTHTSIPIHISTQTSTCNALACNFYYKLGAERVILAREVSLKEIQEIKQQSPIELEVFIHGAMCASYSGKCTISNYSSGRDSNRGGCVQSCRHEYELFDKNQKPLTTAHIMNAKDLNASNYIKDCINIGVDSLKIEGRMKSNMYLANAVESYRKLLDNTKLNPKSTSLEHASNRQFSSGAMTGRMNGDSIHYHFKNYSKKREILGIVKYIIPDKWLIIQVKSPFKIGEAIEIQSPNHVLKATISSISSITDQSLKEAKTSSIIKLPYFPNIQAQSIVKKVL